MFLLLLFSTVLIKLSFGYEIKATGNGIIKPGTDLELTLVVNKVWDRCQWFAYHTEDEYKYCSFDLDPETGTAQVHKCKPENASELMVYTGKNVTECQITVYNFTENHDLIWMARLDEDFENTEIEIIVAEDVDFVELSMEEDCVLGQECKIKCKVRGGKPKPGVSILWEQENYVNLLWDYEQKFINENETFEYLYEVTFVPKIDNHGQSVKCKSLILDGNQNPLYDSSEQEIFLDVKFPPQLKAGQLLKAELGSNFTVTFKIKCNPMPNNVSWIFQRGNETQSLSSGESTEKYEANEIEPISDLIYQMQLKILDVSKKDEETDYFLKVENSLGEQLYMFEIKV